MDVGLRVMKQVQVSTSITLVRFLSTSMKDTMNPLDTCVFSFLVITCTYVLKHEYVLSPLSRRLAVLLALEKVRPLLASHIESGEVMRVHGLMVNAGFLSLVAVMPASWKEIEEVSTLVQSCIYLYSDIFDFALAYRTLHVSLLVSSFAFLAYTSTLTASSSMLKTTLDISAAAFTSLSLSIIEANLDPLQETAIIQFGLIFIAFEFTHIPGLESMEDYMIYSVAGIIKKFIKSDPWYWCGILFIAMQVLSSWLTIKSTIVRVLLLLIINVAVSKTLDYISRLAVYDTIITLKTSALVIQFLIHEVSQKFIDK